MTGEKDFHYFPVLFFSLRLLTIKKNSIILMLSNHSRNKWSITLKSLEVTVLTSGEGTVTPCAGQTPVLSFPANLAVIGNSLRLSYRSPCLGSVFHIWLRCQVHWSGWWNKMPENPLSQDVPSASWWLTTAKVSCATASGILPFK